MSLGSFLKHYWLLCLLIIIDFLLFGFSLYSLRRESWFATLIVSLFSISFSITWAEFRTPRPQRVEDQGDREVPGQPPIFHDEEIAKKSLEQEFGPNTLPKTEALLIVEPRKESIGLPSAPLPRYPPPSVPKNIPIEEAVSKDKGRTGLNPPNVTEKKD